MNASKFQPITNRRGLEYAPQNGTALEPDGVEDGGGLLGAGSHMHEEEAAPLEPPVHHCALRKPT